MGETGTLILNVILLMNYFSVMWGCRCHSS